MGALVRVQDGAGWPCLGLCPHSTLGLLGEPNGYAGRGFCNNTLNIGMLGVCPEYLQHFSS